MNSNIKVSHITDEEYKKIIELLRQDEKTKDLQFSKKGHLYGIMYNEKIVGLIDLTLWVPDNLTISIAILNEYRGKGIASVAVNKLVDNFGKDFPEIRRFIYNVSTINTSSINVAKKLNWMSTSEFDDTMLDEGSEYFEMYYRDNPYYNKLYKKI